MMSNSKYKKPLFIVFGLLLLVGGFFVFNSYIYNEKQAVTATDHKNTEYVIDGQRIKLENGVAEMEATPGSASKVTTRYFGNELKTDLDGDGEEDVAFIVTQETGGSGTYFYAVGAIHTDQGYIGSDGYLLGDRIAPQSTEVSQNPRHKNVVVFNYADRQEDEPMSAQPSVGKSAYLKLDPVGMQWAIVEPDFEGEGNVVACTADAMQCPDGSYVGRSGPNCEFVCPDIDGVGEFWGTVTGTVSLGPTCPVESYPPDPNCADKPYATSLVLTTQDGVKVIKTFSSNSAGVFRVEVPPGEYAIRSAASANILPYCQSEVFTLPVNGHAEITVSCDTGIR